MEAGSALGKLANLPPVQQHRDAFTRSWPPFENARLKPALKFGQEEIVPLAQSAGPVFYPFSGPDFFNAFWLFPDCETYVLFGLEHIGDLPSIDGMNERQVARFMSDVRVATNDLFDRNYFITENMAKHLRTAQLRGVVPLLAIEMALSGMDIEAHILHGHRRLVIAENSTRRCSRLSSAISPIPAAYLMRHAAPRR